MPQKKSIEEILEQFNNEYIMNPKLGEPFGRIPNSTDCGYIRFTQLNNQTILAYYNKVLPIMKPNFKFPSRYENIPIIYQKIV